MTDVDESFDDVYHLIDLAHRETAEADDVPAFVWSRIREHVGSSGVKETPAVSMNLAIASPVFAPSQPQTGGVQRFSGMVATLAIVAILAFGGWFAAMNLPPANDGQQLAVMQATPMAAATCDVEPLTVNQVMSIVENPLIYTWIGPTGSPEEARGQAARMKQEGKQHRMVLPERFDIGQAYPLTEADFAAASETANAYLGCLLVGTQGQVWTFYSPTSIQATILAMYPIYATEDEVRAYVEERIDKPALEGESEWANLPFIDDVTAATINPDMKLSVAKMHNTPQIAVALSAGVVIETEGDGVIVRTNGNGTNLMPNDPAITGNRDIILRITLVRAASSQVWAVVPYPSMDEVNAHMPQN